MTDEGFLKRFREGGYISIVTGLDLWFAVIVSIGIYLGLGPQLRGVEQSVILQAATGFAQSILAVVLVGVSLLVSLTNPGFLRVLKKEKAMQKLFFAFEATAMLAILTTALGMILQATAYPAWALYLFLFLSIYLFAATARIVSLIVSYGERRAMLAVIDDLPDNLGEELESDVAREDDEAE